MKRTAGILLLIALGAAACTPAPIASNHRSSGSENGKRGHDSSDDDDDNAADDDDDTSASPITSAPADEPDPVVDTTELDPFIAKQMTAGNIPGLGLAVVRAGKLKWTKGYGLANIATKKPVGRDTLFMLASVSKTITSVSLMQLIEDPKNGVSLDDDVSIKAGFQVRNSRFASTPITYRMLLTHTSSLIDGDAYFDTPYAKGDVTGKLESFVKTAVADQTRWLSNKPGTKWEYSNTATALVGLLAEKISGQNLQVYAKAHIFTPLGMNETSYFLKDLDQSHIAQPYNGPNLEPQGFYGYPDYPTGEVRTSAPQLAKFLMAFSSGGTLGKAHLLESSTVAEMEQVQFPSVDQLQGLSFFFDTKGGKDALGHDGADKGVTTQMFFDPKTKAGYVLLTNARDQLDDIDATDAALASITDKLMELAVTLP